MKKNILLPIVCMIALAVSGQDGVSWKVMHNKKVLLSAHEEDASKNSIKLTASGFKTKNSYTVSYFQMNTAVNRNKWIRTIAIFDERDNELYRKDAVSIKMPDAQLKKMLLANKIVKVYTWALPKDPKEAARVRIRRVHLCTIELK